jgi:hypothetical protein
MNAKWDRIWQEEVVLERRYPGISLEGLTKTTKTSVRISSIPAKIHTETLPNLSAQIYCYINRLDRNKCVFTGIWNQEITKCDAYLAVFEYVLGTYFILKLQARLSLFIEERIQFLGMDLGGEGMIFLFCKDGTYRRTFHIFPCWSVSPLQDR